MDRGGESPESEGLHESWCEFEREVREAGLDRGRCEAILRRAHRYREEAVAYRLSPGERLQELKLQVKNSYYRYLHYEWFGELNGPELAELLPTLVPASLHWDPGGNVRLIHLVNVALDALPRDLARNLYLDAFTRYLRGFGYYTRATREERGRILREYMWLDRQYIYRSGTAQENREALRDVIQNLLGDEAVAVYLAGLEAAREG